jgi:L-aspartate oxidase
VLATGGYAALWQRTTNGSATRGTGLMLAWRAGASLADLEFVQFHPTALNLPGRQAFLLSEALRGEGGRLIDAHGHDVIDPLLPRDVVARALYRHLRTRGPVYLSLQHLSAASVRARFGNIAAALDEVGLDLARDRLPVAPAAHYCMGGIRTDTWGRTDVAGLYAAGETACTGVQGANRLASNSLLECLVFGARAAEAALSDPADAHAPWATVSLPPTSAPPHAEQPLAVIDPQVLGSRMDADVGVERDPRRLARLVADLPDPLTFLAHGVPEATFLGQLALERQPVAADLALAALVARAAFLRQESRGAHFRTDTAESRPEWRGRIHWRRARAPRFEEVVP